MPIRRFGNIIIRARGMDDVCRIWKNSQGDVIIAFYNRKDKTQVRYVEITFLDKLKEVEEI